MEKIRLGIIGIGNMGSEHCRLILSGQTPEIALTCVADPRQDRRDWAQQTLPAGTGIYADGMSLIRAHACDAVLIATPHELHPPLAEAALRAGLHVLSEKPAGVYTAQLHPVIAAAQETGRTYALMFNQRTNCVYRRLKALLDSGELGALKRVTWVVTDWYRSQAYYDSGAWRATWTGEGGGVLLNQCPHQLDLLQWLCGLPTMVRAFCHEGKWHDIEVEDDVTAYLEFPGGATGVFIASTGDLPGTNRLEIACDRGKVVCENGQLTRLCPDRAIGLEELAEELRKDEGPKLALGDGGRLCCDYLNSHGIACRLAPENGLYQSAVGVALAAEDMARRGETVSGRDLVPTYLRLSQAERERLAKGLKITVE